MSFNPGDEVGILYPNNLSLAGVGIIRRKIIGFEGNVKYDVAEHPAGRITRYNSSVLTRLNTTAKKEYGNKIKIVKKAQHEYNEYIRWLKEQREEEDNNNNNNNNSNNNNNNNNNSNNNNNNANTYNSNNNGIRHGGKRKGGKTRKSRKGGKTRKSRKGGKRNNKWRKSHRKGGR